MTRCEEMAERVRTAPHVIELARLLHGGKWYPSERKSNTGIGKTLEELLGIHENNFSKGDIEVPMVGLVELKSSRIGSQSMITLFTKSPEPRSVGNKQLLERFGYYRNGSMFKELHFTLFYGHNLIDGKDLVLEITGNEENRRIDLIDPSENLVVAYYSERALEQAAFNKLSSGLVLVEAESKFVNTVEYFKYCKATYMCGLDINATFQLIRDKKLKLDLRLGTYKSGRSKGKPHDHGNGFRMFDKDLERLFSYKTEL